MKMVSQSIQPSNKPVGGRNVLGYASAKPRPLLLTRLMKALAVRVAMVIALMSAAFAPLPTFGWYLGHQPQWMVIVERDTVYFGRTDRPIEIDVWPLLVLKLLMVSLPAWLGWRFFLRKRKAQMDRTSNDN